MRAASRSSSSSTRSSRRPPQSPPTAPPITSSRRQPDGLQALQAALGDAVTAAVLLPASEQTSFIGECLHARLNKLPQPVARPSRQQPSMSAAEMHALQKELKKAVSLARRHVSPMRCAADYLCKQSMLPGSPISPYMVAASAQAEASCAGGGSGSTPRPVSRFLRAASAIAAQPLAQAALEPLESPTAAAPGASASTELQAELERMRSELEAAQLTLQRRDLEIESLRLQQLQQAEAAEAAAAEAEAAAAAAEAAAAAAEATAAAEAAAEAAEAAEAEAEAAAAAKAAKAKQEEALPFRLRISENARSRYLETSALRRVLLDEEDIVMLSANWCLERARKRLPLPSRSELPAEAIVQADAMRIHLAEMDAEIVDHRLSAYASTAAACPTLPCYSATPRNTRHARLSCLALAVAALLLSAGTC